MTKIILILAKSFFLFSTAVYSQTGRVFDDLSMNSEILGGERKYAIYLPPCYESSTRSYPVLYLLHGSGDDQSGWIQFGEVHHIAGKAINEGKATPMVIIMPDANTGRRGYFNDITGAWRYEDFFFDEFMPYVEKKYRIRTEKRYRAVSGLSMGGGGALIYALRRPELFSSAAPLSAYVGPLSIEEAEKRFLFAGDTRSISANTLKEYYGNHNALSLINSWPEENKRSVRWYIDCGDDDFLYEGNSLVHIAMKKNEIPHEFRIRDGGHNWTYWRESLPAVLEFISKAFHQY